MPQLFDGQLLVGHQARHTPAQEGIKDPRRHSTLPQALVRAEDLAVLLHGLRHRVEESPFFQKTAQHLHLGRRDAQGAQLGRQLHFELSLVDHPILLHHGTDGAVIAHQ